MLEFALKDFFVEETEFDRDVGNLGYFPINKTMRSMNRVNILNMYAAKYYV